MKTESTFWKRRPDGWTIDVLDSHGIVCSVPAVSQDDEDALATAERIVAALNPPPSSPSPEPERCDGTCYNDSANQCTEEWHRSNRLAMASNGSDECDDPAPSPSPGPLHTTHERESVGPCTTIDLDAGAEGYAVDCCDPDHWFDGEVGRPGGHDGGLPENPKTKCVSFFDDEARRKRLL